MKPEHRWLWRARCLRVIDGDTLDVLIDAGFRATRIERVRLLGVDTPELRGASREKGLAAKAFTDRWVYGTIASRELEWPLLIESHRGDAFGRWLAEVWHASGDRSLSESLIDAGHGRVP